MDILTTGMRNKMKISEQLFQNGASQKFVNALKKGYEGDLWNASAVAFKQSKLGYEILLKAAMVLDGEYPEWSQDLLHKIENNGAALHIVLKTIDRKKVGE